MYGNCSHLPEVESVLTKLPQQQQIWVQIGIPDRIHYLQQCLDATLAIAPLWANAICAAQGIDSTDPLAGEAWLTGPVAVLMNLRQLIDALEAGGCPSPVRTRQDHSGQVIAQIFPDNLMDRLLWLGFKGEVWLQPGQPPSQGQIYRQPTQGKVALVLGAGNVASIGPMDALYKLFVENQVVLLKLNPVNGYGEPFLSQALAPLIADGFLQIVQGGAELGQALCQHPAIDTVHLTGSHRTHDAIVWGTTPTEQGQRKVRLQPLLTKPVTSELGCVTPVLVVPGRWSQAELQFQARHVASMVAHNASFNCVAAKVLVLAQGWPQRQAFLDCLYQALAQIPPRQAYYPGAQERYQGFCDRYPQAQVLGAPAPNAVPWTVIPDVPPASGEYALTEEAFCGLLAEVSLEATTPTEFLAQAVPFANEQIWGSLSCMVLIDPRSQRACQQELQGAIAALRYGGIGINIWTGVIYQMGSTTWGAFPGNPLTDIESGRGVVHNTYLFDHPQKSVVYAPFRIFPKPLWFADHRNLRQVAQRFAQLQHRPSWLRFIQVVIAALRG
ncbi:aldehyde dehydrogenase family protein [Synechococcales cyanobacterium C]|uniref:Aldehyde dehydrogenase family protein n=1 Tax=Petrachloros mirabilis ULC683 TaxID=2781853 RepID=A0A8K2A1G6_9CYAN|nr:aldehyde dehydrogenase family protein [Petrachloros mirabilis]NCJ08082.1 aldehyde dehydrogenase family protein [Petrachloros mirabilis ULC683]